MKSRTRLALRLWLALIAGVGMTAPSSAQKIDGSARSAQIAELSRTGKYSDAIPLAQRLLADLEKAYGPDHRDVAAALNNLAMLYGSQGRDAEAEPLYRRSIAILESSMASTPRKSHRNSIIWRRCTSGRSATPMPSRCSSGRWRSAKSRSDATIPISGSP